MVPFSLVDSISLLSVAVFSQSPYSNLIASPPYVLTAFMNYVCLGNGMFSYEDRRRIRMLESGWRNITVQLPTKPPVFMASEKVIDWRLTT